MHLIITQLQFAGNKHKCLKIKGTDRNVMVRPLILIRCCFATMVMIHNQESGRKKE